MTGTPPERPDRARARPHVSRRAVLATVATGVLGGVAGCSLTPSFPDADVVAGPEGRLAFEPADLTVPVGATVTWGFEGGGHNVSCRPGDSDEVRLPGGADPFASYGSNEPPEGTLVPRGGTFEQSLDVAGRYRYVCIPHDDQGMSGTIDVE